MALLAIAMVIISFRIYGKMSSDTSAFNQVSDDWKLPPIVDLRIVPNTIDAPQNCPVEYRELFTRKWPGTLAGCSCLDINSTIIKDPKHRNAVFP